MKLRDLKENDFGKLTGGKVPLKVKDSVTVKKVSEPGVDAGKFFITLDADGHWYLHTDGKPRWGADGGKGYFDSKEQASKVLTKWRASRKMDLKEGMPSGVVKMKSQWSKMSQDEQYEKLKKLADQKNTTVEDMAKRYDRLFADKTRKLGRLVTQRLTSGALKDREARSET